MQNEWNSNSTTALLFRDLWIYFVQILQFLRTFKAQIPVTNPDPGRYVYVVQCLLFYISAVDLHVDFKK